MNNYADIIKRILLDYNNDFITIEIKQIKNKSDYDSIVISSSMTAYRPKVDGALFARIKENGKRPYIAFRTKYRYWFDEKNIPSWSVVSDKDYFRVDTTDFLNSVNLDEKSFGKLAAQICIDAMSFPKFGCCSRYQRCSDLGKCVHDDLLYASACEYRRNLEAGRNFYKSKLSLSTKIASIDVETPNTNNDAICSIGIVVIDENGIADKKYYLINPETDFDYQCIQIHGITEDDVCDAPTFPEVWDEIKDYFCGYLLTGHNFTFDLSCIKKALDRYQIEAAPVYYIDTLTLSRKFIKDIENHKLKTMCRYFNISLDQHHNALCDSLATAELLIRLLISYEIDVDCFTKKYPSENQTNRTNKATQHTPNTRALQKLEGLLYGVICDGELNNDEIYAIQSWLFEHEELKGNYPYDRIYTAVENILEDGIITEPERKYLFSLLNSILDPVEDDSSECELYTEGAEICLTGDFECMSKAELTTLFEGKGAIVRKNVVRTLDYLIVGDKGSENWSFGNYGTKIKKAMEYNEKGASIKIIRESDILSSVLDD